MAVFELLGVASIAPFMSAVGNMSSLEGNGVMANLYKNLGFTSPTDFIFWSGVFVISTLSIAALVSTLTTWKLTVYGQEIGAELSSRLYRYYLMQDWPFHLNRSSTKLISTVAHDCNRVTELMIMPALIVTSRLVLSIIIGSTVLLIDPIIGLLGIAIFCSLYALLYATVRRRLSNYGREISGSNQERMRLMQEGFGGIRAIIMSNRQAYFTQKFETSSFKLSRSTGLSQSLAQLPRSLIELLAFGSMISFVLYLLSTHDGDLGTVLPVLSIYALAGFKLLPALQGVYNGISIIRGNLAAFDAIEADLEHCEPVSQAGAPLFQSPQKFDVEIALENIVFVHEGSDRASVDSVSLNINTGETVGLVGPSGGGKSTLVDIITGLVTPQEGSVTVNGDKLESFGLNKWQQNIGYVPQSIFLADASIRDNIAFGIDPQDIDEAKIDQACSAANLSSFVSTLPEGLATHVGENGQQLSGGQRQRIGIARALYADPGLLVFDEATSALDGISEKLVMDAIYELAHGRTIILVAHRLDTLRNCDCIHVVSNGSILESGSFTDLSENSEVFRSMGGTHRREPAGSGQN